MAVTLEELARRLECRVDGPAAAGAIEIARVAALADAQPGDLTFLSNPKYASDVASTRASAVIGDDSLTGAPCPVLRTKDVYLVMARAVGLLTPAARPAPGISALASIDPTATIGPDVSVGAFVVVGAHARIGARTVIHSHVAIGRESTVGDDCEIHSHTAVRDRVGIGHRVVLQNGVVIGGDGYGFARRPDGSHEKIPQVGRVVIEDDVEIGANSTVDRPAIGETRIGAGTKIDNLVMVAHGVKIGRNVLLAAQAGIAGSTTLEDGVIMAGQSGAIGHVRLGKGAVVSAKSAVTKDIEPGQQVAGIPAGDIAEWRESAVLLRRLPELRRLISDLDARLAAIEAQIKR
ncbi:MAG TPA: UDP-3-O-(3-hydroxymyristoyl)glucosamine N-acyltransferase [Vicinamibacterales bacterium]|nr:UDP-3-O-(3-hydroxymyristoyl)glucosamine N-acyltransferase [Vicinamibacterales bacterium]